MKEDYKAKDTKYGLDVAIKVLPEEFARDRRAAAGHYRPEPAIR